MCRLRLFAFIDGPPLPLTSVVSFVSWYALRSLHQFNLTRSPGFVEPGLGWAVETQEAEPTLSGNGLDPIRLIFRFYSCFVLIT